MRVTRRDYLQIRTVFNLSVSCHSVKLKEKTWLNCSEKFSLTMHHEFSSSCFRIKILVQKKICIHQTSMRGDDRGLKRERNFIYKKCEQDQIFLEHPKKAWWYAIPSHVPCKAQPSASIQWPVLAGPSSRVGITRFRGNKWETLLNNGDKDHLGHLSVPLPWMCVH